VSELKDAHVRTWSLDPTTLGLPYARLSDLTIDNTAQAADALRAIVHGELGPKRDIALLNAAAALVVARRCEDLSAGLEIAARVIDDGSARRTLESLVRCSNS
jgi:anthranilate phosphoribosyltransferase